MKEDKYKKRLEKNLQEINIRAYEKWESGRQEHKSDLNKLDVIAEIKDEIVDIIAYISILEEQNDTRRTNTKRNS